MVNLIRGTHNHALTKSLSGHPYVGPLTEDERKRNKDGENRDNVTDVWREAFEDER